MPATDYDFLIIGGGQAGVPLAHALARAGRRVALAERRHLGGSCVNFGCTPTKAAFASARLAHQARRAGEYGISVSHVTVDFPAVLARARRLARESREGLESKFALDGNPCLLPGQAWFEGRTADGKFRLRVGEAAVTAQQVVLNTGTRTRLPPVEGLERVPFLDAGNWLDRPELPGHLAILGGGYIGLEMAQFYRRMGSRVTVLEEGNQLVAREDPDVGSALQALLRQEGVEFQLAAKLSRAEPRDRDVVLHLEGGRRLSATHLFIATGRQPNTDDLGLDSIGLKTKAGGIVEVDQRLSSSVHGVWAAGDIRGGPQFTHTAWDDYRILESQLLGDRSRTTKRIVPYAIFTDPELGRVGLTESEARTQGRQFKLGRYEMKNNGRARETGQPEGFIKVLVDAATDRMLGAAVLSAEAGEIVHLYVALMNADAPCSVLRNAIHIHPTLAEAAQSAVAELR